MKISDVCKMLIKCQNKWGDVPVYFMDLGDNDQDAEVEGCEFDGNKIILGDLTRAQDNYANSLDSGDEQ